MPIGEQSTIASHTGNGVATVFAYSFGVLAADDIKVLVNGVEVTTGFTVSGIGSRTGGTVTFAAAPTNGSAILIVREVVRKRDTDYQYSGDLREEVLDDDFDRIWMTLQEDGELVDRGVRVPVGETLAELPAAASRVNKVLTFGAGGAVALVDVAAFSGGGVVELVPADGSLDLVKFATAVQNLINGALQKSGGTMTGALTLSGNAVNPLEAMPLQQATGRLLAVRVFTTANNGQTYTPTAGTTSVIVSAVGGGGAGGGGVTTTSGNVSLGSGGSGGAYGVARFTSGFSGVTLTIGSGGTAAIGGNGGNGGTTSFGALLSCPGGVGGGAGGIVANTVASYSAATILAAAPSGANIQSHRGYPCDRAYLLGGGSQSGGGGSTLLGSGGPALTVPNTGAAGDGYGAGGGGGATSGSAASSGGNGAPGVIIVWEFA